MEFRLLSIADEDNYGFFIANGSLAPLVINGISIGTNMVAGPLPDFAVVEAEDTVFFWWCTNKGIKHLPEDLPIVNVRIAYCSKLTCLF